MSQPSSLPSELGLSPRCCQAEGCSAEQDPTRQPRNCFLKGPGGLSQVSPTTKHEGGSLGGFILIDFVRSSCILLRLKPRLRDNFERLTRTQKSSFLTFSPLFACLLFYFSLLLLLKAKRVPGGRTGEEGGVVVSLQRLLATSRQREADKIILQIRI